MPSKHRAEKSSAPRMEIVLKCDSAGSLEAVTAALSAISVPGIAIELVHGGIGNVSKSDVLLAETAGHLIVGYQVGVMPALEKLLREHRVDVRLYDVIYNLTSDVASLAGDLLPLRPAEEILGTAQVIRLFKSTRKGIIIGSEVTKGYLATGLRFRIISAMGPVYTGNISSMHRGEETIHKALPGQQVGIKIPDFNKVRVGDLVEAFRISSEAPRRPREPRGQIIRR